MKKIYEFFIRILTIIQMTLSFNLFSEIDAMKDEYTRHALVLTNIESGMFAELSSVLGALHLYDQRAMGGIEVELNNPFYLDPEVGPNWWEYFFEPIHLGNQRLPKHPCSMEEGEKLAHLGLGLPKYRAFDLIEKYIHIKPSIQEEVDLFMRENFEGHFVIGIHHRGTDKILEWPLVEYEKTSQTVEQMISQLSDLEKEQLRLYVATDDQSFLTYLEDLFPSLVIYNSFVRSSDETPLHYGNHLYSSNYQKGKEALIDCLLLSQCQMLVRPASSCLSLISTCFNPEIPVISLQRD